MEKISSTEVSSSEVDAHLEALPRPVIDFLHTRDDELQRYRQANVRAHQTRTERLLEAVRECYDDHRLKIEYSPLSARAGVLHGLLKNLFARYGLTCKPALKKCRLIVYEKAGVKLKGRSGQTSLQVG